MKLLKVEIENYRSIKSLKINFEPSCQILVGINESGKSNILSALSLLRKDVEPLKTDLRQEAYNEVIDKAYVDFLLELNDEEVKELVDKIQSKVLLKDIDELIIENREEKFSIKSLCNYLYNNVYFYVNIRDRKKFGGTNAFNLGHQYKLKGNWKRVSQDCPDDYTLPPENKIQLKKYMYIKFDDYKDCGIPEHYFEDSIEFDNTDFIAEEFDEYVTLKLPKTIFWTHEEKNLLPSKISINDFMEDPNICIPLKNMFILANKPSIKKIITEAKERDDRALKNLLKNVAATTTEHFRKVWKEYPDIQFELSINADVIEPSIKDAVDNSYTVLQRSDGFKKFINFLLLISAEVETGSIKDSLLLIDEPEGSLHPSGARYLRDELVKISKNNIVIYSTHSIDMIDKNHIERHLITKKQNEITTAIKASESNFKDEEVIYRALGASIYNILEEKNIIFEGWKDKRLFQVAINEESINKKYPKFKQVGLCHSAGVKVMGIYSSILELANRKCFIISDADIPSKEKQKAFIRQHGYGVWKNYEEFDSNAKLFTGEDYIKEEYFNEVIGKISKKYNLSGSPQFSSNLPKLESISIWLSISNKVQEDNKKEIIDNIKSITFDELKFKHIESSYIKIVEEIYNLIFDSKNKSKKLKEATA